MTFDPATFIDTTSLGSAAAKRVEQRDDVATQNATRLSAEVADFVRHLDQAAARFAVRRDQFAQGKEATCLDLARKLERFGSFASERQADFARKLVGWSVGYGQPHPMDPQDVPAKAPSAPVAAFSQPERAQTPAVALPKLWELMQRLSKLQIGDIQLARKNQDSLTWVKHASVEGVIGKIENGTLVLFAGRIKGIAPTPANIRAELLRIEEDPEAAAVLHGKASGRCAICSRDLTNPESIARAIGPICAGRAGWGA